MNKKNDKKAVGIIVALCVALLVGVVVLVTATSSFAKLNGDKNGDGVTKYTLTSVTNPNNYVDNSANYTSGASVNNGGNGEQAVVNPNHTQLQTQQSVNKHTGDSVNHTTNDSGYDPIAEYEQLSKNGDNLLSDSPNNKYIKAVNSKYKVDPEYLVAIYSSPDTGNNFVLQFKNRRDENGDIIKSPDTLEKVYKIDLDGKISVATGKATGNIGVSYAEGLLCFNMVNVLIMPQHPDYFTGVE
ncbi:MAG: hypothetical protein KIG53_05650 [Oscillospiraceae bacterium]|nr:hypothetical protein [Oscillospiraceae bacterium]